MRNMYKLKGCLALNNRLFKIVIWVTLAAMVFTTVLMSVGAFL